MARPTTEMTEMLRTLVSRLVELDFRERVPVPLVAPGDMPNGAPCWRAEWCCQDRSVVVLVIGLEWSLLIRDARERYTLHQGHYDFIDPFRRAIAWLMGRRSDPRRPEDGGVAC